MTKCMVVNLTGHVVYCHVDECLVKRMLAYSEEEILSVTTGLSHGYLVVKSPHYHHRARRGGVDMLCADVNNTTV
jgi:hypothetical protein